MRLLWSFEIPTDGWVDRRLNDPPPASDLLVLIWYRIGLVFGPIKVADRRWGPMKGQKEPLEFDIVRWRAA